VSHGLEAMAVLKKVELLKGLSNEKYHQLMQALKTSTYSDNQIIVEQSDPGDTFFIVKEGTVDVFRDHQRIRTITKLDYFGERSVLFKTFRSATAVAKGLVSCWELHQSNFFEIIDDRVREILNKRI
jgi:cGMP-dependent protein kinase